MVFTDHVEAAQTMLVRLCALFLGKTRRGDPYLSGPLKGPRSKLLVFRKSPSQWEAFVSDRAQHDLLVKLCDLQAQRGPDDQEHLVGGWGVAKLWIAPQGSRQPTHVAYLAPTDPKYRRSRSPKERCKMKKRTFRIVIREFYLPFGTQ